MSNIAWLGVGVVLTVVLAVVTGDVYSGFGAAVALLLVFKAAAGLF